MYNRVLKNHPRARLLLFTLTALALSILFLNCSGGNVADNKSDARDAASSQPKRITVPTPGVEITALAFSPDGKLLAGANKVWEAETGKLLQTLDNPGGTVAASFSPDGKTLGIGFRYYLSLQGEARLWDTGAWTMKKGINMRVPVSSIAFSPDGKLIAGSSEDGQVRLWDAETGEQKRTLKAGGLITHLAFSPDGALLAVGAAVGISQSSGSAATTLYEISLLDSQTGQVKHILADKTGARAFFSADGKTVATGGKDGVVELWDTATGQLQKSFKGHEGDVDAVSLSPDGKLLASAGKDKIIKIWDIAAGTVKWGLKGHDDAVTSLVFAPDSKTLASAGASKTANVWLLN
jgi:WD40 repeat protein